MIGEELLLLLRRRRRRLLLLLRLWDILGWCLLLLLFFGTFFPLRQEDPVALVDALVDLAVLEVHVALLSVAEPDLGDDVVRPLLVPLDFVGRLEDRRPLPARPAAKRQIRR